MSYLEFDKQQLINLEYSLSREILWTNQTGTFSSSTIINCNTRKYHGMLICPLDMDNEHHVLLSSLDETIIQHNKEFHLAVHKYPDLYHPGHKYIREFESEPTSTIVFRVGGVILKRELLLASAKEQLLIRYTLIDAHSPTVIRLHPFLVFRNFHRLSKANLDVNTKYQQIENGIKTRMYDAYPLLHMQLSKQNEFVSAPDWFYNVEYPEEQKRGYEAHEDLFVPGFFEFPMKKGETIIFSASLEQESPRSLKRKFTSEMSKRIQRESFDKCLDYSADQFILLQGDNKDIIQSFPWYSKSGRFSFISLAGNTLLRGHTELCKDILESQAKNFEGPLFIHKFDRKDKTEFSADTPLWFIYAVQQYYYKTENTKEVQNIFWDTIKGIINGFKNTELPGLHVAPNSLINITEKNKPLTWMNAMAVGKPVVSRTGYTVEINALWYNAVSFAVEIAKKTGDNDFVDKWADFPGVIASSFVAMFWDKEKGFLADCCDESAKEWVVRPNQVFATSLPYSPIEDDIKNNVLKVVRNELLTPKGLRTLSPKNPYYIGSCEGDMNSREKARFQGTVWPWLLGHFCDAYLKLHQRSGISYIDKIYKQFEEEMFKNGIGTLSEMYDGNPPYAGRGAISHSAAVGELIRIREMIKAFK
jgi:predicted glycogen debranching enzyme